MQNFPSFFLQPQPINLLVMPSSPASHILLTLISTSSFCSKGYLKTFKPPSIVRVKA
jgi:hypothetical protein